MQQHETNNNIIFINTMDDQGTLIPAGSSLAIATLRYWLAEEGIRDTAMFPENAGIDRSTSARHFEAYIAANSATIYALSCWSNSYSTALTYTKIIKEKRPDAIIIGGGAHFHSRENITKALDEGGFDIIFQGGAEPFFEFCRNVFVERTLSVSKSPLTFTGKIPDVGLFYKSDGELKIGRRGVLNRAVVPVARVMDRYAEITALFSDSCGNACDYCSVLKNPSSQEARAKAEQLVVDAFRRLSAQWRGAFLISVMDSSPFLDDNRPATFETIRRLAQLDRRIHFSVLVDPDDLDDEFITFAKENRIILFFVGRDRILEDSFTGRRLHGKLRPQTRLDSERQRLADFIQAIDGAYGDVFIGYIASPFDTAENAAKLAEEIRHYTSLAQTIHVVPDIFILNPYGGTPVHKKAGKDAWDVAEFSYPYTNVWNGEGTAMLWLELLRFTVAPVFSAGELHLGLFLLEFAAHCAFGGQADPAPTADDGLLPPLKRMADAFAEVVGRMSLGNEKSLKEWQAHVKELYYWGLMMAVAVRNPGIASEYDLQRLSSYVRANDTLAEAFDSDQRLVASKELEGTWYGRFKLKRSQL